MLELATVAGRLYTIERCTDLVRGDWTVIGDPIAGIGQPVQLLDEGASTRQPRCCYRLRVTFP